MSGDGLTWVMVTDTPSNSLSRISFSRNMSDRAWRSISPTRNWRWDGPLELSRRPGGLREGRGIFNSPDNRTGSQMAQAMAARVRVARHSAAIDPSLGRTGRAPPGRLTAYRYSVPARDARTGASRRDIRGPERRISAGIRLQSPPPGFRAAPP